MTAEDVLAVSIGIGLWVLVVIAAIRWLAR